MKEYINSKPCADALVFRDGKVLLQQRAHAPYPGLWAAPGGHCDFNEHPHATAIRECKEETGIDVTEGVFFGVYMDLVAPEDSRQVVVYLFVDATGELEMSDESTGLGWFFLNELPPLTPLHQRVLDRVVTP